MDVAKVREMKKDVEGQINKLVADFMNETGTRVQDIDYETMENIGGDIIGVFARLVVEV